MQRQKLKEKIKTDNQMKYNKEKLAEIAKYHLLNDIINLDYCIIQKNRVAAFRSYINRKAVKLGDDIFPNDVAELMIKANRSGKYKHILSNGLQTIFGKFLLMIDIYEGLGFEMPDEDKELILENVQTYFW